MRELEEEDLPILDAVVRGGDAAIIRSLRLGRETLAELETLRRAALEPDRGPDAGADAGPDRRAGPGLGDGSAVFLDPDTMRPRARPPGAALAAPPPAAGAAPEAPIDVLLEREVDLLRRELRELLSGGPPATGREA